ncbi:hypothetical protein EDD18DRAFT_1356850 [Armillaria luteobubalina]|uniref:Uncharacterized protein n=1 Tax=Armillaria luteobubalina TaxID=153913 RepID=A0AA39ULV4_9AGAR|nr:hypothetical protein EDD18DRAFT_1356850 [Armillaria luteobubalina]
MPTSPKSYLESLDSTQLAQLILALEQRGVISAPAALPTAPGPSQSAASNHSHMSSSLTDGGTTLSPADVATSKPTTSLSQDPASSWWLGKQTKDERGNLEASTDGLHFGVPGIQLLLAIKSESFMGGTSFWPYYPVAQIDFHVYRNAVARLVLDMDCAVFLPHPSHMAASAHYANAMANDEVEIILTDNEDNI